MSSFSRILGWTPPTDEDYIDVALPEQPSLYERPAFHISESAPAGYSSSILQGFHASSPASSTSSALSDSDKPQEWSKKGDPAWVARPRNEFILFRCDYVRKHSKEGGGRRPRRAPGQEAEKTLSKLAAEAWRALSTEERLYWREQANLERTDHARKYPDYRYRPKKSSTGRRRQSRSSMSSSLVTKSAPAPAVLAPVTVDALSRSPNSRPHTRSVEKMNTLRLENPLRKYPSAPFLSPVESVEETPEWMSLSLPPAPFESRVESTHLQYPTMQPTLHESSSFESLGDATTPALSDTVSIPNSVSSSLMNWNGEIPISAPQPIPHYMPPLSLPLASNFTDYTLHAAMASRSSANTALGGLPPPSQRFENLQYPVVGEAAWNHGIPQQQFYPPDMFMPPCAGADQPFMQRDPSSSFLHLKSPSGLTVMDEFGLVSGVNPSPSIVSPAYLAQSAQMSPDEVFAMDGDEYFPPY